MNKKPFKAIDIKDTIFFHLHRLDGDLEYLLHIDNNALKELNLLSKLKKIHSQIEEMMSEFGE